jgi:hypothetical protein
MPDGKTTKPKLGSKRGSLAKLGTIQELQLALWEIILQLKDEIAKQGTLMDTLPLKACHVAATLGGVYARLHETANLEERIARLEQKVEEKRP